VVNAEAHTTAQEPNNDVLVGEDLGLPLRIHDLDLLVHEIEDHATGRHGNQGLTDPEDTLAMKLQSDSTGEDPCKDEIGTADLGLATHSENHRCVRGDDKSGRTKRCM